MKSKSNATITKGIIFAGCSFTWGQGLYYYSNLQSLSEPPPNLYFDNLVNTSHIKYMESVRFPRKVANHFNTFELVTKKNGGSIDDAIRLVQGTDPTLDRPFDLNDYSVVVFQLTNYNRTRFKFNILDKIYEIENIPWLLELPNDHEMKIAFNNYLDINKISFDEWDKQKIKESLDNVKTCLMHVEQAGLKVCLFTWLNDLVDFIVKDEWLAKRVVNFEYKGKIYKSLQVAMYENQELEIKTDFENFEVPPQDHHPSKLCHDLISDSIIKYLEKEI